MLNSAVKPVYMRLYTGQRRTELDLALTKALGEIQQYVYSALC